LDNQLYSGINLTLFTNKGRKKLKRSRKLNSLLKYPFPSLDI